MSDDTADVSNQGHENALMEMIVADLIPGMKAERLDSLPRMSRGPLLVYRIARSVSRHGRVAGQVVAEELKLIPKQHHGNVMLSFDGWADDPRALSLIPEVVDFCAGMLLGQTLDDTQNAAELLVVLLNEALLIESGADPAIAYDSSGGLWLVAHAYASHTIMRTTASPTGLGKDMAMVFHCAVMLATNRLPKMQPGIASR